jgi:hypothetical protein
LPQRKAPEETPMKIKIGKLEITITAEIKQTYYFGIWSNVICDFVGTYVTDTRNPPDPSAFHVYKPVSFEEYIALLTRD